MPDKKEMVMATDYKTFLRELKKKIQKAQIRAALSVNRELVLLYWQIGRDILIRQQQEGWGAKIVDLLSKDLKRSFPEMKGFSARNLTYMKTFAEAYPDFEFTQQAAAQIPWSHNCIILDKVRGFEQRKWLIQQTVQNGWSRAVLTHQIESRLYERSGASVSNFEQSLPTPQSDLAREILKDPYNFDFITLDMEAHERDIEKGLVQHIRSFLLELGVGFAFLGSQYHIEIGDQDFYVDLLFYHVRLRCFVVVDLKATEFKPEYAGKMNFYLSAVDDLFRHKHDSPTIGLILCKTKNKVVAEYALRDINKPIGISGFQITEIVPDKLKGNLPTIEELETELEIRSMSDE
jgi:predicted nuclease of restriction endonuclease-like (RecB) superfamily